MSLVLSNIKMPISEDISALSTLIAAEFGVPRSCIQAVRVLRQSLDARKKQDIHYTISVVAQLESIWQARLMKRNDPRIQTYEQVAPYALPAGQEPPPGRVVVAGFGPAGLFAAYFLAEAGYAPLVLERGPQIAQRAASVEHFWRTGELDTASNAMFGEGGAGTFSDGKLTHRGKDPRAQVVLDTLVRHGAPQDIGYMAKPHIGTDLLRGVVEQMRENIRRMGGEVRFGATLNGLQVSNGRLQAIRFLEEGRQERVECAACILATGLAARDTYEMLLGEGQVLAPKPFAMGLRVEHPQELIDRAQFGALAGDPRLGPAEYHLRANVGGRGVYTFCMCPGGQVIAASSGAQEVVVNGMSRRARDGANANAAVVVQVGPEDFGNEPLAGVRFQQELERRAFHAGGGGYAAPAQRVGDFLQGCKPNAFTGVLPTYRPGVTPYALEKLLPEYMTTGIREALTVFDRQLRGFALPDAVLTAVESRTSAPVRILRDARGEALNAAGLYPAGEGAGYAGGIVSAAIDGMRAAEHVAALYRPGVTP